MLKVLLSAVLLVVMQIFPISPTVSIDLNKQYQIDNDMWFEGKLVPADVITTKLKDSMGQTTMGFGRARIVIDTDSNVTWSTVRMTLFHEECHVEEWPLPNEDEHGKRFQGCMLRLAREGAFAKIW